MKVLFSFMVALGAVFASTASAQANGLRCRERTPGVNHRQHRQQYRIGRGVRSGELTRRETLRLEREQFSIAREERRAKRDGELRARERAQLQRELNQSSRHIYRATHNGRDRN